MREAFYRASEGARPHSSSSNKCPRPSQNGNSPLVPHWHIHTKRGFFNSSMCRRVAQASRVPSQAGQSSLLRQPHNWWLPTGNCKALG